MKIRTLMPGDAASLSTLSSETFRLAFAGVHHPDNIAAYCRDVYGAPAIQALLDDPLIHAEMACDGDMAVGYCVVPHHPAPAGLPPPASEVKRMYLLPQARSHGVGQALFERAVMSIADAGRRHVWLSVSDANTQARRFYDRLGFKLAGTGPVFCVGSDRVPSSLMVKSL